MKNTILLLCAIFLSLHGLAQYETNISETGAENNPVSYINVNNPDDGPCGTSVSSNGFENGKSCTRNYGRIVAHDIIVPAGEDLTLESLTVNIFMGLTGSGVNASIVDIYYYNDSNGEPGDLIGSELNFFPTSQVVVGSNFGGDIWQVELDVTDQLFTGVSGSPKTYWIGLSVEATDQSNVWWENTTAVNIGHGEAYDDGSGNGFNLDSALEGVYSINADCQLILDVDDNFADQVQVYPNPVTDGVVYITSPLSSEMQVVIYDISGKEVFDTVLVENNQVNVSRLNSGVYFLQLSQDGRSAIKKFAVK